MTAKLQLVLVTVVALAAGWQFEHHRRQARELAAVEAQVQTESQKIETRRAALVALEQRNRELEEAERRAGNQTLLSLMRERAAATAATRVASPASESHSVGSALANVLDSPAQQELDRAARRNEMRAGLGLFFKLVKLPPEKINQYIDLGIEKESRQASRMSALLRGKVGVADALRERDRDNAELENQQRAVLGPEGSAFLDSIAEGMCTDEAKRLVNGLRQGMGSNTLDQEQSDRLQSLIKVELVTLPLDDTDLFRPPEEWAQIVSERQQNVLRAAAAFLTPAQVEVLTTLTAVDLAQRQEQMILKRKSLGIK